MLPTHLSATPFCQGLQMLVRTALIPLAFRKLNTSVPNLRSRSKDDVAVWTWQRQGLSELMQNPIARGMRSGVEMENAAPMMLDDEEAVQHSEAQRGHGKEVEGSDHLTVVLEECQPALHLRFVGLALQLLQIARHGGF